MSSETHSREILLSALRPAHPYFLPSYSDFIRMEWYRFENERFLITGGQLSRIDRSSGSKSYVGKVYLQPTNLPYSSARTYRIRRFQPRCLFPPSSPSALSLCSLNNETPEKWVTSLVYGVHTNPYLVWISNLTFHGWSRMAAVATRKGN